MEFTAKDVRTWDKTKDRGVWYVKVPGREEGWKSSGEDNKATAIAWALRQAQGGYSENIKLEEFAKDFFLPSKCSYVRSRETGSKPRSPKHWHELRVILIDYLLPKWGKYQMSAVLPGTFHDWLLNLTSTRKELDKRPLGPARLRKILFGATKIWDWAVFKGVMSANPLQTIPKIGSVGERRDSFNRDELLGMFPDDLSKVWPDQWGLYFLIAADTGLRPQEVSALQWEDWRPEHRGFYVTRAVDDHGEMKGLKTSGRGAKAKVALVSNFLAEELDKVPQDKRHGLLVSRKVKTFNEAGKAVVVCKPIRVDTAGKAYCAGVDRLEGVDRSGRTLYSLRHAANTRFVTERGADAARVRMGHKTSGMTDRYDHPDEEDLFRRARGGRKD